MEGLDIPTRRVGVVSSPGYRNQKGALVRVRRLLDQVPTVAHREVADPGDVADALKPSYIVVLLYNFAVFYTITKSRYE